MARTPDLAGALEAIVARTLKGTIGPRFRKLETHLRRLERKLKKAAMARGAARTRRRRKKLMGRPRRVARRVARRRGRRGR